MYWCLSFTFRY